MRRPNRPTRTGGGRFPADPHASETQSAVVAVDCRNAAEMFRPYREGWLTPDAAKLLQIHLASCPRCAAAFENRSNLHTVLEQTYGGRKISETFNETVDRRLHQRQQELEKHPTTSPKALSAVRLGAAEEYDEYDDDEDEEPRGFFATLAEQFHSTPWWVGSGIFHGLLLLLLYLVGSILMSVNPNERVITTSLEKQEEPEEEIKEIKRDIQKKNVPTDENLEPIPDPVVTHEKVEYSDHNETDDSLNDNMSKGDEDAISDVPLGGTGTVAAIGLGGGRGGAFGQRGRGGRRRLLRRGGGGPKTERAVDAALAWLARHQEPDGHWSVRRTEGTDDWDPGVTGLAVLAFLGAGHSERVGKYKDNVRRAVAWIISQQRADGAIGTDPKWKEHHGGYGYHHAICGMALAEAAGMGRVKATRDAAQKAIDYTCDKYQCGEGSDKLGWRYKPKAKQGDLSVSGWYIMQLKSAKVTGLHVDPASFDGAIRFLDSRQADPVNVKKEDDAYDNGGHRYGYVDRRPRVNTTAIGILCRLFTGVKPDEVRGAAEWLLRTNPPEWKADLGPGNGGGWPMYYTYYATLTMFQVGGDIWKTWNKGMKKMLLGNQDKGGPRDGSVQDKDGSWEPLGAWEKRAGRAYTTALGALSLEVYYRYLPMYR